MTVASHAGVFRGARFAPLKMPAWEASMTGALCAKGGERDISRGSYRAPREISRLPRLAHKAPVMQAMFFSLLYC